MIQSGKRLKGGPIAIWGGVEVGFCEIRSDVGADRLKRCIIGDEEEVGWDGGVAVKKTAQTGEARREQEARKGRHGKEHDRLC